MEKIEYNGFNLCYTKEMKEEFEYIFVNTLEHVVKTAITRYMLFKTTRHYLPTKEDSTDIIHVIEFNFGSMKLSGEVTFMVERMESI